MIRFAKIAGVAALAAAFALPAIAQQTTNPPCVYPTATGTFSAPCALPGSLDASGKFVPNSALAPPAVNGATSIPTYAAALVAYGQSSAGDLYCINGSASTIVRVKKFRVSAIASAAVTQDISVVKRSTADACSGGCTPTTLTNVPLDSSNAAATASVTAYSSSTGLTPGTTVGTVRSQKHAIGTASSTAIGPSPVLFDFYSHYDQAGTLRGVGQGLCVVVGSTAGGSWNVDVEWTESAQ